MQCSGGLPASLDRSAEKRNPFPTMGFDKGEITVWL
jgi:hypothetical protein